jgi:hydrogenase maturation factor
VSTPGEPFPPCLPDEGCITCGDEAAPMRVLEPAAGAGLAVCLDGDQVPAEVDVALVEPVEAGDTVLVHAGVALTRLEPGVAATIVEGRA